MILHYIIHSKSWSYVINVKTVTGGSCGCSVNVVVQKSRDPHKPKMNHEDKRQSNNKKGKSKVQISENSRRKKQTHTKARHEETLVGDRIQTDQDTQTMGSGTGEEGKEWTNTGRRNWKATRDEQESNISKSNRDNRTEKTWILTSGVKIT